MKGARPWYDDVEWWGKWIIWVFVSFLRCLDMGVDHFEPLRIVISCDGLLSEGPGNHVVPSFRPDMSEAAHSLKLV